MFKTVVASTVEMDDSAVAVEEILAQLNLRENQLAHTVGIITCHYEFVYSGVYKAICDSLPFDVTGTISPAVAIGSASGTLMLTLMVLTSDDTEFKVALTEPLVGEVSGKIEKAYRAAAELEKKKPALVLAFAPFMMQNSGDEYVNVLTKVSGGAPCFGTLAVDDSADFHNCFMLHNGEYYSDRMSVILLQGSVKPSFAIATISKNKIIDKVALITSSDGHILKELNGKPVVEYFRDLGLTQASETSYAMTSLPFMLDYCDGTPQVSRVFIGLNEQGHAICAGAMPEGATLYIGVFDKDDVLRTTREAVRTAAAEAASRGMLIFSCISRNMSLVSDVLAELDLVRDELTQPFMMAYSGGEICPTETGRPLAVNRFHNNAFILCSLGG